jgi:(heptosyl)LPS beta-1,4-glucosyltransferase
MGKISVVINTLNEEKNLPRVLASIKNIADEIIVVDMRSEDQTKEIAKKAGALVFEHEKTNYVEPARNYAISKAKGEWILIIDADEEVPASLSKKLRKIAGGSKADYYRIPRKNIIFGKWLKHSRWWPDYNIRFFKKGHVTWDETIHSVPLTTGVGLDLAEKEEFAITHHHYQNLDQYIERMNRYTNEHAKSLVKDGYKFRWQDLFKKPTNEFLSRYFFAEGYKDGVHGLALSFLQAFSECVKYLKVWQLEKFEEIDPNINEVTKTIKESQKELNYWIADVLIKNGKGVMQRIKRKFKLL